MGRNLKLLTALPFWTAHAQVTAHAGRVGLGSLGGADVLDLLAQRFQAGVHLSVAVANAGVSRLCSLHAEDLDPSLPEAWGGTARRCLRVQEDPGVREDQENPGEERNTHECIQWDVKTTKNLI